MTPDYDEDLDFQIEYYYYFNEEVRGEKPFGDAGLPLTYHGNYFNPYHDNTDINDEDKRLLF